MSDLIERQAAIDTLDKHLRTTDVPVSYPGIISALTEWLNELPSAQADSKETSSTHKALDTISRQAVIDALDVLCQEHRYKIPGKRETYSQYNEAWQDALDRAEGAVFNLPPVQPEVIRCKDCKHSEHWYRDKSRCFLWHEEGIDVFEDGFCSYAERRTDDH